MKEQLKPSYFLGETLNDCFKSALKSKHERPYQAYSSRIQAMTEGRIQSVLETDSYTPKEKNVKIMIALVESDLAISVLFDNIQPEIHGYSIGGRHV